MRKSRRPRELPAEVARPDPSQSVREQDVALAHRYVTTNSQVEAEEILIEASRETLGQVVRVLTGIAWLETYFGGIEQMFAIGLPEHCVGAALGALYEYPERYTTLREYIPDAALATVISLIYEYPGNIAPRDWQDGRHSMHQCGFTYFVARQYPSDDTFDDNL